MKVYVMSLNDFSLVRTFDVEPFMFAHSSNCWERDGELFIDVIEMSDKDGEEGTLFSRNLFTQPRPSTGQLTRYRLDMKTGASKKEILPSAIPTAGRLTTPPRFRVDLPVIFRPLPGLIGWPAMRGGWITMMFFCGTSKMWWPGCGPDGRTWPLFRPPTPGPIWSVSIPGWPAWVFSEKTPA